MNLFHLVIWGCAGSLLLCVGSSLIAVDGAAAHGRAFPCRGAQAPGQRLQWLRHTGAAVAAGGPQRRAAAVLATRGCGPSKARGIFPDCGSNPRPLRWQVGSYPLHHQRGPIYLH